MAIEIKVKRLNKEIKLPRIYEIGDWIDLRASEDVVIKAPQARTLKKHKIDGKEVSHRDVDFSITLIPLGVAIKLPKGFEALLLPRSSTAKKFGIIQANSQGIIDESYQGNKDEWKFPAIGIKDTVIKKGDRICQFRIQPSQKATFWQKLKWLLSSNIKIVEVDNLEGNDRGGFGSTGKN